ncbi:MAG: hypothetical protein ACJAVK_002351 [Akkermansiaceae bacterium]|jgi:uncharacterized protein YbaP (TraB family)
MKILSALLLSVSLLAQAREKQEIDTTTLKHPLKPALWKVEGKDLQKPSYLFGTIHLGDPRVTTLHPDADKAFIAADHFYAEIDLDPAKQMALSAKLMRQDGKTLTESIGPDLTAKLKKALQAINPVLNPQPFEPMKTWVIGVTLPTLGMQLNGKKALDVVLFERAQKENKTVGALETADSQLKIFDDLKEAEQISVLKSTLEALAKERKEEKDSMKDLLDLYLTKDVPKIGKFLTKMMAETDYGDRDLSDRLMKKVLDDRNITMAETISKALAEKPGKAHFFAVGAAHYTGATAIQDLLTKKGYTITPAFK